MEPFELTALTVVGTAFALGSLLATFASVGCYLRAFDSRKLPFGGHYRIGALRSTIFVWGLTSLLYFWIASGGPRFVRWLVYPFCAAQLYNTKLDIYALFETDKARRNFFVTFKSTAYLLVILTVLPGVHGEFFGSGAFGDWWLVISFVVATIVQIALFVFLVGALPNAYRLPWHEASLIVCVVSNFAWIVYPLFFALEQFGVVTPSGATYAYVAADLVTKIAFELYSLWLAYNKAPRIHSAYKKRALATTDTVV